MVRNSNLIIDVRTREEFLKEHIKGAINIPLYDLDFYGDFLKDKELLLYSKTGIRSQVAENKLKAKGYNVRILSEKEQKDISWEINVIVLAIKHLYIKPEHDRVFRDEAKKLLDSSNSFTGFLGGKLLKISGISGEGSNITGNYEDFDFIPAKYKILSYWESKEVHEQAHQKNFFKQITKNMHKYYARIPYEEFYEVIR